MRTITERGVVGDDLEAGRRVHHTDWGEGTVSEGPPLPFPFLRKTGTLNFVNPGVISRPGPGL